MTVRIELGWRRASKSLSRTDNGEGSECYASCAASCAKRSRPTGSASDYPSEWVARILGDGQSNLDAQATQIFVECHIMLDHRLWLPPFPDFGNCRLGALADSR